LRTDRSAAPLTVVSSVIVLFGGIWSVSLPATVAVLVYTPRAAGSTVAVRVIAAPASFGRSPKSHVTTVPAALQPVP